MAAKQTWEQEQARRTRAHARERAGAGWTILGPELRQALIAHELVRLLLAQAASTYADNPALTALRDVAALALQEEGD